MLWDKTGNKVSETILGRYDAIIFYGASTRNKYAIQNLGIQEKVLYFIDSDSSKNGTELDGYMIYSTEKLAQEKNILIISVLANHEDDVLQITNRYNQICLFYAPENYDFENAMVDNKSIMQDFEKNTKKYKYVHIFANMIFIQHFYQMIEENDNIQDHLFLMDWGNCKEFYLYDFICDRNRKNKNILIFDDIFGCFGARNINQNLDLYPIFFYSSKILLHSAFLGKKGVKMLSDIADKMGEKMLWICWGRDSCYSKENPIVKNVLTKVGNAYASVARIPYIQSAYGILAKRFYATYNYINKEEIALFESAFACDDKNECRTDKITLNVLLGHSAYEYGNHNYGIQLLERYRDENITIYCPLAYGIKEYANEVIKRGKEVFGNKFIPLLEFMEPNKYYELLNKMDIIVFPMTAQAAGTQLTYLSTIGKKIYLTSEMIHVFYPHQIHAEELEHIRDMSFEEFARTANKTDHPIEKIKKKNRDMYEEWQKILDSKTKHF